MILQSLPSRALVRTMLTLVLEGTRMLGLDVHMDGALVLPHKGGAMRALKLAGLGANVFERHWGTYQTRRGNFQFFWATEWATKLLKIGKCVAFPPIFVALSHGVGNKN